jgi:hypothetical protein
MSREDIEARIIDQMPAQVRQTYYGSNSPTTKFLVQALVNEVGACGADPIRAAHPAAGSGIRGAPMNIRNRVKELRNVAASSLRPNPKNWRTHSDKQKAALQGVLADIGYAVPAICRQLPDGSLQLLDGHLRTETMGDALVPVIVLAEDVTDEEADLLLATIDPLSALAGRDDTKIAELLANVSSDSAAVQEMLADLYKMPEADVGEPAAVDVPAPRFEVLVSLTSERDQAELLQELTERGLSCRSLIS